MLATAGYDRQVLIWDLATGKVVRRLKDHSDSVYGLAFSPDGKTLASCAADRTVKLWDWATGRRTVTLSESTGELYAVVFTPEGSHVLAAGVDRSIRMWRVDGHGGGESRLERSAFAHDAPVLRLAVSADGKRLASSAEDRTVRIWELNSLTPSTRESIPTQADWAEALAFSPRRPQAGDRAGTTAPSPCGTRGAARSVWSSASRRSRSPRGRRSCSGTPRSIPRSRAGACGAARSR